jgi:hypothetical protein
MHDLLGIKMLNNKILTDQEMQSTTIFNRHA